MLVRYLMVSFVHEATQKTMIRLFAVVGSDYIFNMFMLNNGLVAFKIQEVSIRQWWATPEDKKQYVFCGKECLK